MFANFLITLALYQTYEMCFSKKSKHIEKEAFGFAEKQYFVKKTVYFSETNSQKITNEIRQQLYCLYCSNKITKAVYNILTKYK